MIEHAEARLQLSDLVVAGLAEPTRLSALKGHVAVCDECQVELAELRAIDAAIRDSGPIPIPSPALTARVLAGAGVRPPGLRDAGRATRLWRSTTTWRVATAAAVGVALLAALTALTGGAPAFRTTAARTFTIANGWAASGSVRLGTVSGREAFRIHLTNLKPLSAGYYELWVARSPDDRLSLGVYAAAPDGTLDVTVPAPGGEEGYQGVWLTAEPEDGDPRWSDAWVAQARFA